ncbi:GSCOCT00013815001.3-RA-CDS, partial [Cotesia congregata]
MEKLSSDQKQLDEGVKIFDYSRRVSKAVGLWPLASNDYIFTFSYCYFTVILIFEWMDLYYSLDDLNSVLDNLTENLSFTQIYIRGIILRIHMNRLKEIIKNTIGDFSINSFKNPSEIKIFMTYIDKGRFFVKSIISFMAMTVITWYFQPLTTPAPVASDNETILFLLPYRCHIIFEINDSKSYMLTYITFAPHTWIDGCSHASIECLLITLVYYLRGRLIILAGRIDRLSGMETLEWKNDLQDIIVEHIRLLKLGNNVIDIYSTSLMVYMICTTTCICVIGYKILVNCMTGPDADLVQFFIYIFAVYLIMAVFCFISEQLMSECDKISEAFWNCEWYRMPPKTVVNVMFCIQRSQRPLTLKIGKFAHFGHNMLTVVTKTAMGYLSVLRNFLVIE